MDTSELLGAAQYGSNGTPPDSGSEGVVNTLLDAAESAFPQLKLARQVLKTKFGYDVTFYFIGLYVLYGLSFPLSWLLATIRPGVVWLFTSSIVIPRGSQAFESCIDWVTANVVNERSRLSGGAQTLTAFSGNKNRNRRGPHMPMDYNDGFINPYTGHPDGSFNDDTFQPLTFTPSANGRLWISDGWQFWKWVHFKHKYDKTTLGSGMQVADEEILLTCLGWSTVPLEEFIKKCRKLEGRSSGATQFHNLREGQWQPPGQRPSRPLSTIDMDPGMKEALVADVQNFLRSSTRRFYSRRGIPWRRGFLFYGMPGTGKSSMSIALAGSTDLDLYILDLANFRSGDYELANAFDLIPTKCIVLIEDIDSAGIRREGEKESLDQEQDPTDDSDEMSVGMVPAPYGPRMGRLRRKVTLSGLLNVIDGICAREGRIVIMTTNDPEALDPALIRPGRVDMKVYFGPVQGTTAKAIFLRIYTKDPDDFDDAEQMLRQKIDPEKKLTLSPADFRTVFKETFNDMHWLEGLADQFAAKVPEGLLTPAEVQGFLLERMQDPERAVRDVRDWVHRMKRQKDAGRKVIQASPELKGVDGGTEQEVDGEMISPVEGD